MYIMQSTEGGDTPVCLPLDNTTQISSGLMFCWRGQPQLKLSWIFSFLSRHYCAQVCGDAGPDFRDLWTAL